MICGAGAHPLRRHRRGRERGQGRRSARASTRSSRPPTSTSSHQLQTTREDVLGAGPRGRRARRELRRGRRVLADGRDALGRSSSPPRSSPIAIEEGATTINIPDTVGYTMPHEYGAWLTRLYELVPGAARRGAVGALPRRPRAGGRELVRGRAGGRAPGRVRDQRDRRARRQRVAGGDRDAAAHARRRHRAAHRDQHARDRAHEPAGLAADRLRRAAEQGDRRAATRSRTSRASTRTACSRSARPTRSWTRRASGWRPTRWCSASTPAATRCARRWRTWASRCDGPGAEHRVQALQGDRRPQEDGHARWTSRRSSPTSCARRSPASRSRAIELEARHGARAARGASSCARRRARRSRGEGSGDGPVDSVFAAINAATGIDASLREFRDRRGHRGQGRARRGLGGRRRGRAAGVRPGRRDRRRRGGGARVPAGADDGRARRRARRGARADAAARSRRRP